jgi:hypothetical protein
MNDCCKMKMELEMRGARSVGASEEKEVTHFHSAFAAIIPLLQEPRKN